MVVVTILIHFNRYFPLHVFHNGHKCLGYSILYVTIACSYSLTSRMPSMVLSNQTGWSTMLISLRISNVSIQAKRQRARALWIKWMATDRGHEFSDMQFIEHDKLVYVSRYDSSALNALPTIWWKSIDVTFNYSWDYKITTNTSHHWLWQKMHII